MTATMANVDAALKNDYQPAIREQLRNMWMLLSQIESNSKDVEGRYAVLSLHVKRNAGVGGRAASAALPTPGKQGYAEERVSIIRNYGAMAIEGDLIDASASDKGSFGRMLDAEMKGMVTDLKNDVSRQVYGDSTKSMAQCGVTSASNVVVLTNPTVVQLKQLSVGTLIDIGTLAGFTTVASDREVTAVDVTNGTITIDGAAVTTAATDYVFRAGTEGNELTGLREIIRDDGTLFNVDPTVHPVWKSTRNQGAGGGAGFNSGTTRVPTELIFEKVIEDIHFESDEDINLICTTRGVRRNFAAQYQGQREYTNSVDIKAGFKAVTVAAGNVEVPLVVDNDAPLNAAWFVNTNHLTQHVMGSGWSFLDRDNSVLHLVPGFDKYQAFMRQYHELTTDRRNSHGVAEDLTEA